MQQTNTKADMEFADMKITDLFDKTGKSSLILGKSMLVTIGKRISKGKI